LKFAISGETRIDKCFKYDVAIVGAGIAGLYTALNLDERLSCLILAKESIDISNSWLAQGGIAAAISVDDNPVFHLEDTITAGAGLCDLDAVKVLVGEGPSDIARLVSLNVPFDLDVFGELQITREGGHHRDRIVHAGGDATGRETVKALASIVAQRGNITFCGQTRLFDVLCDPEDGVVAAVVRRDDSEFHLIETRSIVIATGGVGQVFTSTTNPTVATGDGLAAAMRAGAVPKDLEFIQFHPTGLCAPSRSGREFLISEAIRGEGGILVNSEGVRFMEGTHELQELAPRDIVARAIVKELRRSGEDCVYIDITSKSEGFLKQRFPTIYGECLDRGINIAKDWIPVRPVQHYMMGGIGTDLDGCTGIKGLYACGEAAHTGVHGANRLASNSMLECLVFGRRAARHISGCVFGGADAGGSDAGGADGGADAGGADSGAEGGADGGETTAEGIIGGIPTRPRAGLDFEVLRETVRTLMNEYCGVIRKKTGLTLALGQVNEIFSKLESVYSDSGEYLETLNIATVAKAILEAALRRPESIGSHYMEE
jgi:L-aspartate oxidase